MIINKNKTYHLTILILTIRLNNRPIKNSSNSSNSSNSNDLYESTNQLSTIIISSIVLAHNANYW